uniref:Uncharacterized protein n=1 Tax=Glossina pallidipes TaxID=7398 RepID=A0A1B0A5C6_GLOPL
MTLTSGTVLNELSILSKERKWAEIDKAGCNGSLRKQIIQFFAALLYVEIKKRAVLAMSDKLPSDKDRKGKLFEKLFVLAKSKLDAFLIEGIHPQSLSNHSEIEVYLIVVVQVVVVVEVVVVVMSALIINFSLRAPLIEFRLETA